MIFLRLFLIIYENQSVVCELGLFQRKNEDVPTYRPYFAVTKPAPFGSICVKRITIVHGKMLRFNPESFNVIDAVVFE